MDLTDSVLNYNNTENAKIHGKLSLKNKIIYLEDFYFKENKFLGTINLEKEYLNLEKLCLNCFLQRLKWRLARYYRLLLRSFFFQEIIYVVSKGRFHHLPKVFLFFP